MPTIIAGMFDPVSAPDILHIRMAADSESTPSASGRAASGPSADREEE